MEVARVAANPPGPPIKVEVAGIDALHSLGYSLAMSGEALAARGDFRPTHDRSTSSGDDGKLSPVALAPRETHFEEPQVDRRRRLQRNALGLYSRLGWGKTN